jgi:hypothetical protein
LEQLAVALADLVLLQLEVPADAADTLAADADLVQAEALADAVLFFPSHAATWPASPMAIKTPVITSAATAAIVTVFLIIPSSYVVGFVSEILTISQIRQV